MNSNPYGRYRNHREALRGSFTWPLRLGKKLFYLAIGTAIGAVLPELLVGGLDSVPRSLVTYLVFWLAAWLTGGAVLYLVNALAGGIMSREERRRRG